MQRRPTVPAALAVLAGAAIAAGCAVPGLDGRTWALYACEGGATAEAGFGGPGEPVRLRLSGRDMTLEPVPAASGTRYSDGTLTFWDKGGEALLIDETTGEQWRCRRMPPE
jgi:membrane-bound inhibitor of C-type lysozyme